MGSHSAPLLEGRGLTIVRSFLTEAERNRNNVTAGPASFAADTNKNMWLRAMGSADDQWTHNGELHTGIWFMGRNVPPGPYTIKLYYPHRSWRLGTRLRFVEGNDAAEDGSTPTMNLDPFLTANGIRDPRGIYRMVFTSQVTGESIELAFVVWYESKALGLWPVRVLRLAVAPLRYSVWKALRIKGRLQGRI